MTEIFIEDYGNTKYNNKTGRPTENLFFCLASNALIFLIVMKQFYPANSNTNFEDHSYKYYLINSDK